MTRFYSHWSHRRAFCLALGIVGLFLFVGGLGISAVRAADATPAHDTITWTTEHVGPQPLISLMSARSVRLDSNGRPRIVYGGDHLYYASFDGANWTLETVDPDDGVGLFASLALDSLNRPHISYYDANRGILKYATNQGAGWSIQVLDVPGQAADFSMAETDSLSVENLPERMAAQFDWRSDSFSLDQTENILTAYTGRGLYTSIAVDVNNRPNIAYYDALNGDLKYASMLLGRWQIRTIDSNGDVGSYAGLALDSSTPSNAYFSYYDATNQDLKYAVWDAKNLAAGVSTVDTKDNVGQYTSIAVTSNGSPHISYYDVTNANLKYAKKDGNNWTTTTVVTGGDVGKYTSIVLDSSSRPVISFHDATGGEIWIAAYNGQTWGTLLVSGENFTGLYTSLAIDKNNKTYMSYYDGGAGRLKYAVQDGSASWLIYNVAESSDVGMFPSLVFDQNGYPRISYFDDTHDNLMYAYWDNGWHVSTVDANGDVGMYSDLVLDSGGAPRIAYYDSGRGCLKYAYWAIDHWTIQDVDCKAAGKNPRGLYASLVLDGYGRPFISYYDADKGSLNLAYWDNNWVTMMVDDGSNNGADKVGLYSSLAIDSANNVHISYYDETDRQLMYARPVGLLQWQIVNVGGNQVGMYSEIVVDKNNYAHIACLDDQNEDRLMYFWFDAAGGHSEVVDTATHLIGVGVGALDPISLAVDSNGVAHISYYDFYNQNLLYARRAGSWRSWVVENLGDVGQYSSVATSNNLAAIAYYDATNGDLVYASSKLLTNQRPLFLPLIRR